MVATLTSSRVYISFMCLLTLLVSSFSFFVFAKNSDVVILIVGSLFLVIFLILLKAFFYLPKHIVCKNGFCYVFRGSIFFNSLKLKVELSNVENFSKRRVKQGEQYTNFIVIKLVSTQNIQKNLFSKDGELLVPLSLCTDKEANLFIAKLVTGTL